MKTQVWVEFKDGFTKMVGSYKPSETHVMLWMRDTWAAMQSVARVWTKESRW